MAVNTVAPLFVYGMGDSLIRVPPQPIVSTRAPTVNDLAQIGTLWCDTTTNIIWGLASLIAGIATWTATPAAGATILASLAITGAAGLDVQNAASTTTISSAVINFNNAAATTTIAGNLTIAGITTIAGDLDLTSGALIDLTSTLNAAPSIYLHANGGVNEQILLRADQGTTVTSIELLSDLGGITLNTALASNDAINFEATSGGIDMNGALQINIDSAQAAATAIVLNASNAAGGIDMNCGTAGATLDSTGAISIDAAAASNFSVGGAGIDLTLASAAGRVIVNGEEAAADAITFLSAAGGLDSNTALQTNIDSSQAAANAIRIFASNAAGGLDLDCGTAGATLDSTGAISIDGAAASNFTVGGAGIDLTLASTLGRVIVNGEEAAADAITLLSVAGGLDSNTALQTNIDSSQAAVDAVRIVASGVAGGIDIDCGTGGVTVDSTGAFSIDGVAASNVTTTGAGIDLTLSSVLGSVLVSSTENAPLAIRLHANGGVTETIQLHADQSTAVNSIDLLSDLGGITLTATGNATADAINISAPAGGVDVDAALQINIDSAQAAATAIVLNTSNAAGGLDINVGTGGATLDTTGAFSIDGATASNITVTGATQDLTLSSIGGSVAVVSTENIANCVWLHANAGAAETIEIQSEQGTTANAITLQADQGGITLVAPNWANNDAINLTATAGGVDVDAALQINVASAQAAASAIVINSSNAAGGIDLLTGGGEITINATGGNVAMVPATVVAAGTAATLNARIGVVTLTGNVTASGADIDLDITNAFAVAGCGVLATVSNQGANDADILCEGVNTATAGHLIFHCINAGPAALNGNITVTFWIIN